MEPDEALALIARAQSGDRDAEESLIKSVRPWCWRVAKKIQWRFPQTDLDDLTQVGLIAVFKSIRCYDPARGVSWITYSFSSVSHSVYRYALHQQQKAERFPESLAFRENPEYHAATDPDESPQDRLAALLDQLTPLARLVVESAWRIRFVEAPSLNRSDQARALGLSTRQYRMILAASEQQLRELAETGSYN
jgi:RNA polymerase sigma factor (sigma-70 family)